MSMITFLQWMKNGWRKFRLYITKFLVRAVSPFFCTKIIVSSTLLVRFAVQCNTTSLYDFCQVVKNKQLKENVQNEEWFFLQGFHLHRIRSIEALFFKLLFWPTHRLILAFIWGKINVVRRWFKLLQATAMYWSVPMWK